MSILCSLLTRSKRYTCTKKQHTDCDAYYEAIVDWFYQISDHFCFDRNTVAVAANFLERFSSSASFPTFTKRRFQLAAMSSFQLAAKINDSPAPTMAAMAKLSRGLFSPSDLSVFQEELLHALDWFVHPPLGSHFLYLYGALLDTDDADTLENALWLVELSVCDNNFRMFSASTVGLGAILYELDGAAQGAQAHFAARMEQDGEGVSVLSDDVQLCKSRFKQLFSEKKNMLLLRDSTTPSFTPKRSSSFSPSIVCHYNGYIGNPNAAPSSQNSTDTASTADSEPGYTRQKKRMLSSIY